MSGLSASVESVGTASKFACEIFASMSLSTLSTEDGDSLLSVVSSAVTCVASVVY
mgnify:CR=1 FL=1